MELVNPLNDVPEPPPYLGESGAALFRALHRDADFSESPAEGRLVLEAAKVADMIAALEVEVVKRPLRAKGSQGQPVIAPEVAELRFQRAQLQQMLKAISSSTIDEDRAAEDRSAKARRAANVRWQRASS